MKKKVLEKVDDFVRICQTMFKLGAAEFAKTYFPDIIDGFWDDNKTDEENLEAVKDAFSTNETIMEFQGKEEQRKVFAAFREGWLNEL